MATGNTIEKWITTNDGVSLYTKTWKTASEPPTATVVFIHGFGEHIDRYNHVFEIFQKANIEVYAFDQRGFGRTAARNKNPGVTGGWKVATEDITTALRTNRQQGIPQFLFGHSMGGALVINYAAEGEEKDNLAGYIASAPLLKQSPKTAAREPTIFIGNMLGKLLPSFQFRVNLGAKHLSRIPEEVEKYEADPLVHSIGSLRGVGDMLSGSKAIMGVKHKNITKPIFITHGNADNICCHKTTQELIEKIPSEDKIFRSWEGGYHELHNDLEKEKVINEYVDWILARV
ncbi:hypothetical protein G9A89_016513 [Geosiphon pyriformis]|nr:hypothetical protein G9A89_011793 [Geosiphon pyriformis]KAG9305861.1 hypothetical protein G9A89_016513 [Geosiphon pyriformis]